jgi:hypothetical protein
MAMDFSHSGYQSRSRSRKSGILGCFRNQKSNFCRSSYRAYGRAKAICNFVAKMAVADSSIRHHYRSDPEMSRKGMSLLLFNFFKDQASPAVIAVAMRNMATASQKA